ncbi:hypothetical protein BGZ73_000375, partial [Actinomortierella ambigua]
MGDSYLKPSSTPCAPLPSRSTTRQNSTTHTLQHESTDVSSSSPWPVSTGQQDPPPLVVISPTPTTLSDCASSDLAAALSRPLFDPSDFDMESTLSGAGLSSATSNPIPEKPLYQQMQLSDSQHHFKKSMSVTTDVLIHLADIRAAFNTASQTCLREFKTIAQRTLDQVSSLHDDMVKVKKQVKNVNEDICQLKNGSYETTQAIKDLQGASDALHQTISQGFQNLEMAILKGLDPLHQTTDSLQHEIIALQQTVDENSASVKNTERSLILAQQYLVSLQKSTRHAANESAHIQQQSIRLQQDISSLPRAIVQALCATNTAVPTDTTSVTLTTDAADVAATVDVMEADTHSTMSPRDTDGKRYDETPRQEIALLQQTCRTHGRLLKDIHAEVGAMHHELRLLVDVLYKSGRSSRSKRARDERDAYDAVQDKGEHGKQAERTFRKPILKRRKTRLWPDEEEEGKEEDDEDESAKEEDEKEAESAEEDEDSGEEDEEGEEEEKDAVEEKDDEDELEDYEEDHSEEEGEEEEEQRDDNSDVEQPPRPLVATMPRTSATAVVTLSTVSSSKFSISNLSVDVRPTTDDPPRRRWANQYQADLCRSRACAQSTSERCSKSAIVGHDEGRLDAHTLVWANDWLEKAGDRDGDWS